MQPKQPLKSTFKKCALSFDCKSCDQKITLTSNEQNKISHFPVSERKSSIQGTPSS